MVNSTVKTREVRHLKVPSLAHAALVRQILRINPVSLDVFAGSDTLVVVLVLLSHDAVSFLCLDRRVGSGDIVPVLGDEVGEGKLVGLGKEGEVVVLLEHGAGGGAFKGHVCLVAVNSAAHCWVLKLVRVIFCDVDAVRRGVIVGAKVVIDIVGRCISKSCGWIHMVLVLSARHFAGVASLCVRFESSSLARGAAVVDVVAGGAEMGFVDEPKLVLLVV